jgi:hypothetical protein
MRLRAPTLTGDAIDRAGIADDEFKSATGFERLRAQEVDGRDEIVRGVLERRGDDARLALRVVRVAQRPRQQVVRAVEDGLARAQAFALLVARAVAQDEERCRLDDGFVL